jgi:glycosyltransferase involved in cell wall biosynthesis
VTLLVLAPNPTSAASTRFRLEQFFPALRAAGIEPVLRPFLDERALALLYRPGHALGKVESALAALAGRIADLARSVRARAVLIHREAALVGPPVIEWLLARVLNRPIVFDLDDAIWVPYASPTYGALLSRLLKMPQKTSFTVRAAAHIIAGNHHVADYARRHNANVELIPTVVDTDLFRPLERPRSEVPVLGWIGTHSSLQYLRAIVPALQTLAGRRRFRLRVLGGTLEAPGVPVESVPWTLESEVAEFQALDIGLYPLVEDDWSLGKSGFKAVQYMACGAPVVASPVGATTDIVRDGDTGFFATNHDAWVDRLTRLIDDTALRSRLGAAGRADAVARWSLQHHAPRFVAVVQAAMRSDGAAA